MATFVATDTRPFVGALDLTAMCESVMFGDIVAATVPFTNMAAGGYIENKPGLISGEFTINLFQDFAVGVNDDVLGQAGLGTQYAVTLVPNSTDLTAYLSRGYVGKRSPLIGGPGAAAKSTMTMPYDTKILRGVRGEVATTATVTGNGTARALAGPSATQTLYATLHVTAYSGLTNAILVAWKALHAYLTISAVAQSTTAGVAPKSDHT